MRVWQLARELQVQADAVIDLLRREGEHVTSHLNVVPGPLIATVRELAPPPSEERPSMTSRPAPLPEAIDWEAIRARRRSSQARRRRPGPRPVTLALPWDEDDGYADPEDDFRDQREATTRDVANYAGVKPSTVRHWVRRGYVTPRRWERNSHVFDTDEVLDHLDLIVRRRRTRSRPRTSARPKALVRPRPLTFVEFDSLNRTDSKKVVTLAQAASMTGLAPATLRSWVHRGHLHVHASSRRRELKTTVADVFAAAYRH